MTMFASSPDRGVEHRKPDLRIVTLPPERTRYSNYHPIGRPDRSLQVLELVVVGGAILTALTVTAVIARRLSR